MSRGRPGALRARPQRAGAKGSAEISLLAGPESKHQAPGGAGRALMNEAVDEGIRCFLPGFSARPKDGAFPALAAGGSRARLPPGQSRASFPPAHGKGHRGHRSAPGRTKGSQQEHAPHRAMLLLSCQAERGHSGLSLPCPSPPPAPLPAAPMGDVCPSPPSVVEGTNTARIYFNCLLYNIKLQK